MSGLYNNAVFVNKVSKIPEFEHYGIFVNNWVQVAGWDLHDPTERKDIIEYRWYPTREDWESAIKELTLKGDSFRAVLVTPAKVDIVVTTIVTTPVQETNPNRGVPPDRW